MQNIFVSRMIFLAIFVFALNGCSVIQPESIYYRNCNKAELDILEKDYEGALSHYKKAFKTEHPGYADDYFNALKVTQELNEVDFAVFCGQNLLDRGICAEFFDAFSVLNDKEIRKELFSHQDTLLNKEYRVLLNRMYNEDQVAHGDYANKARMSLVDSINFSEFKKLIQAYGFPSEKKVGIECSSNKRGFHFIPLDILLTHFSERKYTGVDDILRNAVSSHKLTPHKYMYYVQYIGMESKFIPVPIVRIEGEYYQYRLSKKQLRGVNKARKKIGAPSLEDHVRKIRARINKQTNGYRFFVPIDQYPKLEDNLMDSLFIKIIIE